MLTSFGYVSAWAEEYAKRMARARRINDADANEYVRIGKNRTANEYQCSRTT
jgi:hypothetical protein